MKILIVDNYAVLIVVQIKVIDLLNKGGYFLNMFYNESMKLPRIHIWTSVLAGIFMAVASAAGIFLSSTYLKESSFWAAQGTGQDYINLFIVFPALLISAYLISKGSTVEEAINLIKEKRPTMHLQDSQKDALEIFKKNI